MILVRSQKRPKELEDGLSDLARLLGVSISEAAVGEDFDGKNASEGERVQLLVLDPIVFVLQNLKNVQSALQRGLHEQAKN